MFPREFLATVLPSPGHGHYCAAGFTRKSHKHFFDERLEALEGPADSWLQQKRDVYFALSTFEERGSRTAENARYTKALFIDMDGYASKRDAAQALAAFLADTGLDDFGVPWAVSSGGGIHCYWPFAQALPIDEWKPVAEAFKALCAERALRIDMSVTADAARVLRLPGTFNFKAKYPEPRPVRILTAGVVGIDFEAFAARVMSQVRNPQQPPRAAAVAATQELLALPGKRPTATAAPSTMLKMLESTVSRFKSIMERTAGGTGCLQLEHYVEHAADEGMEPLWRGWLSIAKVCVDGDKASRWLSGLHPYETARMEQKLREIKGPYPCIKFDSENPGLCHKCRHFGKITNPLALGRELVADETEKVVELPPDEESGGEEVRRFTRPKAPYGFSYGVNGGVFKNVVVEDADGSKRKVSQMVLPNELFVVDLLKREEDHLVHMIIDRKDGPTDVLLPQRAVVSKDDTLKELAKQNILAARGADNDKHLFAYVRACVEEASTARKAVTVPTQYGWQEDGSFVFSGKIYKPDGATVTVPMPELANLTRNTRIKGSLEAWRRYPQMLIRRGLTDILAMACVGFGAPLMKFSQLAGLTFHAGSTNSGTGKSLALSLLSSIWGDPAKYRTGKSSSAVAMQQRMGNLNSLPFTSDEITHKSRHDLDWFPGLIFDFSEGQGKEKSETHHNRERLNNVTWSTLAFFTSNTYMHDHLSGGRGHSSQGELFRMLEWTPEQKLEWSADEEDLLRSLNLNFGVAGDRYVRWLVQNPEAAKRVYMTTLNELKSEWKIKGDERYWVAGCAACIAGATLASSTYSDVIDLPLQAIRAFFFGLIKRAREVVAAGARNEVDVLNAFTRENYGQFVIIKLDEAKKRFASLGDGRDIDQSITRSKIMGRVEHEIEAPGVISYYIEEQVMKAHCVALSYGYGTFKEKISGVKGYVVSPIKKNMMAGTKGPQMIVNALRITRPIEEAVELEEHKEKPL